MSNLRSVMQYPCESIAPRIPDADKATFPSIAEIQGIAGRTPRPLKVCIATEDIVGPIRNGGIGTTYTHLSFLLADAGHDVTILYPRGSHSETNTIEYWIDWYRERGVRFVPLDLPTGLNTPAARWLRPMMAVYDALKAEHFDMVHVSEWRGLAYLCLLAKKQGLHFQNTLFCMKSSSPYLWNREFMLEAIPDTGQLVKIFAERRSIELADMVIGGSRHLLVWMLRHGYRLPGGRTYVQPNVAVFAEIDPELMRSRPKPGTRVPIKEIVFFGRLEGRKGLDVFCDALHKLHLEGIKLPKITFLGKFGARIATYPEMSVREYIKSQASSWGVDWQIIDNYRQAEAITYLHGEGRLAVMPSVIENSSLTVYEATHFSIPFVASNCGGNPELVAEEHCEEVLTPTHPVPLSEKLREALEKGGFVAAPSFDNDANLGIWRSFHANISTVIDESFNADGKTRDAKRLHLSARVDDLVTQLRSATTAETPADISVCLVLRDNHETIATTLTSLAADGNAPSEIILVNDGSEEPATLEWLAEQKPKFGQRGWQVIDRAHYGTPDARNFGASHASGDFVLFLDPGTTLKPKTMETLVCAASHSGADVMLPFHEDAPQDNLGDQDDQDEQGKSRRIVSIKGDPCFPFFNPDMSAPLVLVKRSAFNHLGGFTTDYKMAGDVAEFLAAATMAGMAVQTIPEVLAIEPDIDTTERLNERGAFMRAVRPYMAAAPLCFQPLLLTAGALEQRWTEARESNATNPRGLSVLGLAYGFVHHSSASLRARVTVSKYELKRPGTSLPSRYRNAAVAAFKPPKEGVDKQVRRIVSLSTNYRGTGLVAPLRNVMSTLFGWIQRPLSGPPPGGKPD